MRIAEIPITYRARKDRPKLASLRDGVKIGLFLCKRRLEQAYDNVGQTHVEKKDTELEKARSITAASNKEE